MFAAVARPAMAMTQALEASAGRHPRKHLALIVALLVVAASAIALGVFALGGHTVHAAVRVQGQTHHVAVQASPSSPVSVLAIASVAFGGISTLAAVVSTVVAVLAFKEQKP